MRAAFEIVMKRGLAGAPRHPGGERRPTIINPFSQSRGWHLARARAREGEASLAR